MSSNGSKRSQKQNFVSGKKFKELFGVSDSTLRRWDAAGKIETIRMHGGKRLYSASSFSPKSPSADNNTPNRRRICYCRVSTAKQMDDLVRQEKFLRKRFPEHDMLSDVGSGLNWKRKNFSRLLVDSFNGKIQEIVIAHRDRLCRFGFELLETIFGLCNVKLLVLDKEEHQSPESELSQDLLSIITVFNSRQMGRRRYSSSKSTKRNIIRNSKSESSDSSDEDEEDSDVSDSETD